MYAVTFVCYGAVQTAKKKREEKKITPKEESYVFTLVFAT